MEPNMEQAALSFVTLLHNPSTISNQTSKSRKQFSKIQGKPSPLTQKISTDPTSSFRHKEKEIIKLYKSIQSYATVPKGKD
jgi:hypothetical protein